MPNKFDRMKALAKAFLSGARETFCRLHGHLWTMHRTTFDRGDMRVFVCCDRCDIELERESTEA